MLEFQKLGNPQLIELEGENGFIIATEIDISNVSNKVILFKGKLYNYDDGELTGGNCSEIQFNLSEDMYYKLDENGNSID